MDRGKIAPSSTAIGYTTGGVLVQASVTYIGSIISEPDGAWDEVPIPRRWHRCKRQTWGWTLDIDYIERCACGAKRLGHGRPWTDRNSRRSSCHAT